MEPLSSHHAPDIDPGRDAAPELHDAAYTPGVGPIAHKAIEGLPTVLKKLEVGGGFITAPQQQRSLATHAFRAPSIVSLTLVHPGPPSSCCRNGVPT